MDISKSLEKIFAFIDTLKGAMSEDGPGGKKITFMEAIRLGISGSGVLPAFADFKELIEDWKSRDEAKKKEWLVLFKDRFDLNDDELELHIESIVASLLSLDENIAVLVEKFSQPPAPGQDPPDPPDDGDED